jgi:GTPase SAR1 family protein
MASSDQTEYTEDTSGVASSFLLGTTDITDKKMASHATMLHTMASGSTDKMATIETKMAFSSSKTSYSAKNNEFLVSVMNSLRDTLGKVKDAPFELPRIAVVGSQSAGKSSVLESMIGHSFMPRGSGIVTRCPCEYRMHKTAPGSKPYGMVVSATDPATKYDFRDLLSKIVTETGRMCGDRGLSAIPIIVDIFCPDVVELTLVDLPGAVRVAGDGQDEGIVEEIKEMILKYIQPANVIILAVSAANTDLANSDALALSKKVDPKGERTMGVSLNVKRNIPPVPSLDTCFGVQ